MASAVPKQSCKRGPMERSLRRSATTVLLLALWGCAKAGALPVAILGLDQTVVTGSVVTLDGSNSKDPESATPAYEWAFQAMPAGSKARFTLAETAKPQFVADVPGKFIVQLIVRGRNYASEP